MSRPSDVYLGVIDVFVILLPGAVLLGVGAWIVSPPGLPFAVATVPQVVVWATAAYILGHFVSALGSFAEDKWNNLSHQCKRIEEEHKKFGHGLQKIVHGDLGNFLPEIGTRNVRRLAGILLTLGGGEAAVVAARKDADRRLFRNLVPAVFVLTGAASMKQNWPVAGVLALLTILAAVRYHDQNSKYARVLYEHLIVAHVMEKKTKSAAGSR